MRDNEQIYEAVYLGEFPPPYGGVTVKNKLLYDSIFNDYNCKKLDIYTYTRNLLRLPELYLELIRLKRKHGYLYLGSGSIKRTELLIKLINFVGGEMLLNHVNIFVMGGVFNETFKNKPNVIKLLRKVGLIYYELHSLVNDAKTMGLNNSMYFPNCRDGNMKKPNHSLTKPSIRLVFFSTVNREKGVPELLEMAKILNERCIAFTLDIYGELQADYKDEFEMNIKRTHHCNYCGVFDGTGGDVYSLLNSYDLLLLPTHWQGEGCIGVLVESKIAGIPAIASDWRYNSEIIIDGKEGVIVSGDQAVGFADAVERISKDEEMYNALCKGASDSIERYDFNIYLPEVKRAVENQLCSVQRISTI